MPTVTVTTVKCDRCQRVIPSGYVWPYSFGPDGPMQVTGGICADLPNSCRDLILAVFWHTVQVSGGATDPLG